MSDNQEERLPSSSTEANVVKSNLDVSVFGDELNVFVKAPENASDAACNSLI